MTRRAEWHRPGGLMYLDPEPCRYHSDLGPLYRLVIQTRLERARKAKLATMMARRARRAAR